MEVKDIYYKWLSGLDIAERFRYDSRKELIGELVGELFDLGFTKQQVLSLKSSVVKALVSKEGMKNTGKYKGWKDNVISDFEQIVSEYYLSGVLEKLEEMSNISKNYTIETNKEIVDFLYKKFDVVTELMIIEAHTVGTVLNKEIIEEINKGV